MNKNEKKNPKQADDELERAYEELQRAETPGADEYYSTGDIVYDIIFFIITVVGAFAWLMLMLLFISFVTLSVLHFELKYMILASVIFAIVAGIWYIRKKVPKYKGHTYKRVSNSGYNRRKKDE